MSRIWKDFLRIVAGVVAELSDQNAYQRHLAAHRTVHSPEQWRRFQDERAAEQSRRPRCC
jgi:hypothetical protein